MYKISQIVISWSSNLKGMKFESQTMKFMKDINSLAKFKY
jgi:hypothetical protein